MCANNVRWTIWAVGVELETTLEEPDVAKERRADR